VAVAAAPAASGAGEAKKDSKKEAETPSAKSEEQAMEGLSSLFG
jgi:ribosomal protein L12E/L44/L45/RPP1/RPP2